MSKLPECECRVHTEEADIYFCRHPKVHSRGHQVNGAVCRACSFCASTCPDPRPIEHGKVVDRRPFPPMYMRAWSLAKAVASFAADGLRTVSKEQYADRLEICEGCAERRGNRCVQCGCYLNWKATARAFRCPLGNWPQIQSNDQQEDSDAET